MLSRKAINEPIIVHGPFEMNTDAEVIEAIADLNSGKFGEVAHYASVDSLSGAVAKTQRRNIRVISAALLSRKANGRSGSASNGRG